MERIRTFMTGLICLGFFSCGSPKKAGGLYSGEPATEINDEKDTVAAVKYDTIQIKYAALLKVAPERIRNPRLYYFIEKWMNTPYKWGGTDERGIDCSAFLQRLLGEVYTIQIPRTSVQQFFTNRVQPFASTKYLAEGDLVFFKTINNTFISHVGLYLQNRMFVNSSSSRGVSIANLDDPYWRNKYVAAGRVKSSAKAK